MTYSLALMLVASLAAGDGPADAPAVTEVEKAVVAARQSIRKGKVSWDLKRTRPTGEVILDATQTQWFDLDTGKRRSDVITRTPMKGAAEGQGPVRHIEGFNCERPDYYLDYFDMRLEKGVTGVQLKPLTAERKKGATELCDPRLLGLRPDSQLGLHHYQLESALDFPGREKPAIRRDRWKDTDCWVISFQTARGNSIEYWVAPSQGYNVVRAVTEATVTGKRLRGVLEVELAQDKKSGLWFPQRCVHEQSLEGKPGVATVVVNVTEASLNEPVDDEVFSLAGMNIRPGTLIEGELPNGKSEVWEWTGEKVAGHVNPPVGVIPPASSRHAGRSWLLIPAGVLALLATLALVFFIRSKRRQGQAT
ncbi:MAG TPA: hypothetical protein VKA46_27090 [Gemmataceae bacterium]|nr:hypothetical protein [Gemmataceae bacterium]